MNLKKYGQLGLLITAAVLFLTGLLGIGGLWKLTFGAFGFGASFVLIFFGDVKPPEE